MNIYPITTELKAYFKLELVITDILCVAEIHSSISAEESDTAPHVTVIYKASSGEDLSEVNITSNDESVGSDSNLKWVPSTNERGSTSETQAVNERHESVSSLANKSPRLSPQHSKRELLVSGLNKTSSASREELCEAQLSDDIEKNLPELISLHEESLTNIKSEKDYVGTTDSTERFRASPEPSCTSGKTHLQSSK